MNVTDHTADFGLSDALKLAALTAVATLSVLALLIWATGGFEQMERVQAARAAYASKCHSQGGNIITFRKSNIRKACLVDGKMVMVR